MHIVICNTHANFNLYTHSQVNLNTLPAQLGSSDTNTVSMNEKEGPLTSKQFKHFNALIMKRLQEEGTTSMSCTDQLINQYFNTCEVMQEDDSPIIYWLQRKELYKELATLALDISASSVPVERAFSTARERISTKRNRLTNQNFETEVLIKTTSITLYCNKIEKY